MRTLSVRALGVAGSWLLAVSLQTTMADARPNFVFFLVDDLRYNGAGAAGHPFAVTPHIDRIANEGIRFTNASVTTPLCGPSRHCFLTGKYARTTGARSNGATIDWETHRPFTQWLQEAGYQTAFIGKSHLGNLGIPITGFNYWAGFPSQGVYYGTEAEPIDMKVSTDGVTYTTELYTNGEYNTDLLTGYAENWLDSLSAGGSSPPFCLLLWYKAVHQPREPAARHADLYSTSHFTMTPAMTDPVAAGKPQLVQDAINAWLPRSLSEKQASVDAFARKDARTLAAVDDSVRDILDRLTNMGVLDNTVIVFTSDNGFFFSDFGLGDKRWQYDPSIRIPWFLRYPPLVIAGRTSNLPVLNIDLAPTFLDLAGVPIPADVQGRSLKPILENNVSSWRTSFLTEYFLEANFVHPTMDAISTEIGGHAFKYVHYLNNPEEQEVYDLANDPYEIMNAIDNPALLETIATLMTERQNRVNALTPAIPESPDIDLGTFNHDHGLSLLGNGDGRTEAVDIGGRNARKTIDPAQDHYMYFAAWDEWAFQGNRPDVEITIDYYDAPTGTLSLQYDAGGSERYKSGGSVTTTGSGTWRQHTFHVADAYLGNRQNAGADFRIAGGGDTFYIDRVQLSGNPFRRPAKASNPSPSNGAGAGTTAELSWSSAQDAESYDVYFGTSNPPVYKGTQTQTTFDPGQLQSETAYFWRIDPGNSLWITTGDLWTFTTTHLGDFDCDGDVDQEDFGHFQACLSGDGVLVQFNCRDADMDSDDDVDPGDFAIFRSCLGGANQLPGC